MASAYVFTCAGADGEVIANAGLDARGVPHCPSGGTWALVQYAEPAEAFDPSQLDPAELASAFAAGFVVLGTGMLLSWAARLIVSAVRGH